MCVRSAVTFLEYWKRKNATIAYYWDCYAIEEAEVSVLSIRAVQYGVISNSLLQLNILW